MPEPNALEITTTLESIGVLLIMLVAGVLILLAILGQFLALFIGRRAADVAIGNIVSNLIPLALFVLLAVAVTL